MRKIYTYTLFIVALSFGFASCQKDDLYRPGGNDTELNNDTGDEIDDPIVDPDDPDNQPRKKPIGD